MTAICGSYRQDAACAARDTADMLVALTAYGLAEPRQASLGGASMGCRLTPLVPEDAFDAQPYRCGGGRYLIVGDVRLTERDSFIADIGLGAAAPRMSDLAVVAAAVERWGEDAIARIYGPFAIAIWDAVEQHLLLARDPLGERPLYYSVSPDRAAFASMPEGLVALGEASRALDRDDLLRLLTLADDAGASPYSDVRRVPPGHIVRLSDGRAQAVRYWQPDLTPLPPRSHASLVVELRERLGNAVEAALRGAERGVGAHLSAGFDSSAVASTAAIALSKTGRRVVALTVVPRGKYDPALSPDVICDEGPAAAMTAAMHDNMDHVLVGASGDAIAASERYAIAFGEPLRNPFPLLAEEAVAAEAKARGLGVILTGDAGNATISYHGMAVLPELLAQGRVIAWFRAANAQRRRGKTRWRGAVWNSVAPWLPLKLWRKGRRAAGRLPIDAARYSALRRQWLRADNGVTDILGRRHTEQTHYTPKRGVDARLCLLSGDNGAYRKGMLSRWGIDYRDPTADRRLVEFTLRIPSEHYSFDGEPRALIRHVLADRVPAAVLSETRRGYQGADWLDLLTQIKPRLSAEVDRIEAMSLTNELFDVPRLRKLIEDWPAQDVSDEVMAEYRYAFLDAVSAAQFIRKVTGSNH